MKKRIPVKRPVRRSVLTVIAAVLFAAALCACSTTVSGHKVYESRESLIETFEANADEFTSVMETVQSSGVMEAYFEEYYETGIVDITRCKKYMEKDQYRELMEFWEKYKPYCLYRDCLNFIAVLPGFDGPQNVDLVYLPGGTAEEVVESNTYYWNLFYTDGTGQIEELHDGWFAIWERQAETNDETKQ